MLSVSNAIADISDISDISVVKEVMDVMAFMVALCDYPYGVVYISFLIFHKTPRKIIKI
jgi:hypothetical protein